MLNRERSEVIDAAFDVAMGGIMSYEFQKTFNINMDDVHSLKEAQQKVENWLNSEYIEPFKITQAEKCILESFDKDIDSIMRTGMSHLYVTGKDLNPYECICVFDHLFKFIKNGKDYKISDILENCEVVKDETNDL